MKTTRIILFFAGLLTILNLRAQQVVIKADTVIAHTGDSINVAIHFSNFSNVGSVTLYIQYSTANLVWSKGMNWLSEFNNGFNLANAANGIIAVSCINYSGVNMAQGKLLDLRFKYSGGLGELTFMNNCEITDLNGNAVTPTPVYKNGIVVNNLVINLTGLSTLCQGSSGQLMTNPNGLFGNYTYQWASVPPGFSSASQNPSVTPSVNTRYYVTVTSGGHFDTASHLVSVVNPGPPGAVPSMLPLNGTTGVSNPVSLSWAPASNANLYDVYVWASGSPMPVNPTIPNLSQINTSISNLIQGTTYNWKVVSKNACFQTSGPEYQFTMLAFPDLHVTQVTNSPAMSGQPIEISWTVKNDGLGATTTPLWYDRVWISPDIEVRVGEPEHILLGTFANISALAPGESYTQTQQFILPQNLIGTYYIFVVTDALDALFFTWPGGAPTVPYNPPPYAFAWTHGGYMVNVVQEASDNGSNSDNFFYKEVTLAVPPLPDLFVTNIVKPASIFSGQSTNVTWTVLNQGQVPTSQSAWSDKVYISADTAFNAATATLLGTFTHNGILLLDSTYTRTGAVTIPNYISGNYFIYVQTDASNQVFENVWEANNITRSDTIAIYLTPPPDLVVTNIDIPPSASNKESISIKFTVINQGATATTAGAWHDKIYLSPSPASIAANSIILANLVHAGNLASFTQYSVEAVVPAPPLISGPWYVFITTDADNVVYEYSDLNNTTRSDTSIIMMNPDLVVSTATIPGADSTDQSLLIQWYDKNQGPGKCLSNTWMDKIYISPNAIYDPYSLYPVDSLVTTYNLDAGDSLQRQKTCQMPDVNSGDYYMYITTDTKNQVFEGIHEDNNTSRSAGVITIKTADLIVTSVSGPSPAQSGLPLSIDAVIMNNGAGTVVNKNITDKVFLSLGPIYNPGISILLGNYTHLINLAPGDTSHVHFSATLPNGITGLYYLIYYTDFTDVVKEGTLENNNTTASAGQVMITAGPWVDLHPLAVTSPDTAVAGFAMDVSYTVINSGTKDATGINWKDKIYRSSSPVWDSGSATLLKTIDHTGNLKIDSSYNVTTSITVQVDLAAGTYYLYVFTDALNTVYEYTDESNNVSAPNTIVIKPYPVDIMVANAVTDASAVNSGQAINFNYSVSNTGTVPTTAVQWYDALYLSTDTIFNSNLDIFAGKWNISGPINPGNSNSLFKTINVPNGISGDYYLFVVTDMNNQNHDINYPNNIRLVRNSLNSIAVLTVTLTPAPDLSVFSLSAPPQVFSGQQFKVYFTVKNTGAGVAHGPWTEKLYLSQDFQINNNDVLLGTHTFSGNLPDNGGEYSDSITVTVNIATSANYVLILKTDGDNVIYEGSNEDNNTLTSFIIISIPPPGDLIVSEITPPVSATVGENTTITWKIKNIGDNTLSGQLKDAVYFSNDTVLSAADGLWTTLLGSVSIPSNSEITRSVTFKTPGVLPGDYHVFVKTDITNVFFETNEDNNKAYSAATVNVDYLALELGITHQDTLINQQSHFYKIVIPAGDADQTFVLTMKGDSLNGVNQLYASFGKVPSLTNYDYLYKFPYKGNQELVIPVTQAGTYYFLVTGNTSAGNMQQISLLARILQFEIRTVDRNFGGNSGSVTVLISGSKFTPDMQLFLVRDSIERQATYFEFIDPSEVLASFSLVDVTGQENDTGGTSINQGIPLGFYDVVARKPDGEIATLADGFQVVEGLTPGFIYNIQCPSSVRVNRYFAMSIQFTNTGNVDINVPVRTLMSMFGAPIGLSIDELVYQYPDLYLEFREPGGPPHVLRPGVTSEIKIYCKSSSRLVFKLIDN